MKEKTTLQMPEVQDEGAGSSQGKANLQAGEKAFHVVLFLTGLFAFSQALLLWLKMDAPRIASAAALPLFVSGLWTLLALVGIFENLKHKTPLSTVASLGEKILGGLRYAFPMDMLIPLLAIITYCVLLMLHVNFYICTALFLYGTMCFLTRKHYGRNILWTGIVMAFIVLVFRVLFGVVFP